MIYSILMQRYIIFSKPPNKIFLSFILSLGRWKAKKIGYNNIYNILYILLCYSMRCWLGLMNERKNERLQDFRFTVISLRFTVYGLQMISLEFIEGLWLRKRLLNGRYRLSHRLSRLCSRHSERPRVWASEWSGIPGRGCLIFLFICKKNFVAFEN